MAPPDRDQRALVPILRAPMRARDRDAPVHAGTIRALREGFVGTGDALDVVPGTIDEAVTAATDRHGEKAGRLLRRFAEHPDGVFVWAREAEDVFRLGRLAGPWRYDDGAGAREDGLHHLRPAVWIAHRFSDDEVPAAVVQTFDRGGRNLQRTHDADAERATQALWHAHAPAPEA